MIMQSFRRSRRRLTTMIWNNPVLWECFLAYRKIRKFVAHRLGSKPPLGVVMLEPTNHCNLSCVMCGNHLQKRDKGYMAQETFDRFIQHLPEKPIGAICMFAVGEPLLHTKLAEFFNRIRHRARERVLSTNALLFLKDESLLEKLIRAGMNHLHCSGDGYDEATYETVRINGRFDDFLESLKRIRETRDRLNPEVVFELQYCLVNMHTLEEFDQVFRIYGELVDEIVFKPLNNQANVKIPFRPSEEVLGYKYYLPDAKRPCVWLWRGPTVLWDGRVSACCRNYCGELIMGHIDNSSLTDIWESSGYQSLREAHIRGEPPQRCRGCCELQEEDFRLWMMNRWIRKQLDRPDYRPL